MRGFPVSPDYDVGGDIDGVIGILDVKIEPFLQVVGKVEVVSVEISQERTLHPAKQPTVRLGGARITLRNYLHLKGGLTFESFENVECPIGRNAVLDDQPKIAVSLHLQRAQSGRKMRHPVLDDQADVESRGVDTVRLHGMRRYPLAGCGKKSNEMAQLSDPT
jgi:hypothetical protein